jgi:hypothetical protein
MRPSKPDLTLFNCTFKTRWPLLNICGVSEKAQAGIAMIGGQAQEWYQWIVQELLRARSY